MSTASTDPSNCIALMMANPDVFPDPGGPKIARLHSDADGMDISRFLSLPNISPFVSCQDASGYRDVSSL